VATKDFAGGDNHWSCTAERKASSAFFCTYLSALLFTMDYSGQADSASRRSSVTSHLSPFTFHRPPLLAPGFWLLTPPPAPRFSLIIGSMCGRLPSPIMEVAGTVSWILAQKNSTVWTVRPDTMVYDAIKMMADKNVGALPVVQNDKLVGIVSERDYTRKVILQGRSSKETRVSEIMSTNLVVTHPNESLTGCMHMMTDKRVRHLPVLEDGKLVGILSIGDALKWLISAQTATIEHLEQYISGGYPS